MRQIDQEAAPVEMIVCFSVQIVHYLQKAVSASAAIMELVSIRFQQELRLKAAVPVIHTARGQATSCGLDISSRHMCEGPVATLWVLRGQLRFWNGQ